MQDFYILQRTSTKLDAGEIRRWYLTVDMLAPDNIIMGDDNTNSFMLGSQEDDLLYIVPLVRHLTEEEAERIEISKQYSIVPAYNKGPYMVVPKSELKTAGKKV